MDTEPITGATALTVTDAITLLGGFGLFQWLIVASFAFMSPPQVYQILFMLFGGADPPWKCAANSSVCRLMGPGWAHVGSTVRHVGTKGAFLR